MRVSVFRSARIVDHKIPRHRRIRVIVVRARYRLPQMGGEIGFEVLLGEVARQHLARGQAGGFANSAGERRGQACERRTEISGRIHAAHQAHGLLDRRAGIAQRLGVERADAHALDKVRRPEMARLAFRTQAGTHRADQHRGGKSRRKETVAKRDRSAHASNPEFEDALADAGGAMSLGHIR